MGEAYHVSHLEAPSKNHAHPYNGQVSNSIQHIYSPLPQLRSKNVRLQNLPLDIQETFVKTSKELVLVIMSESNFDFSET